MNRFLTVGLVVVAGAALFEAAIPASRSARPCWRQGSCPRCAWSTAADELNCRSAKQARSCAAQAD